MVFGAVIDNTRILWRSTEDGSGEVVVDVVVVVSVVVAVLLLLFRNSSVFAADVQLSMVLFCSRTATSKSSSSFSFFSSGSCWYYGSYKLRMSMFLLVLAIKVVTGKPSLYFLYMYTP